MWCPCRSSLFPTLLRQRTGESDLFSISSSIFREHSGSRWRGHTDAFEGTSSKCRCDPSANHPQRKEPQAGRGHHGCCSGKWCVLIGGWLLFFLTSVDLETATFISLLLMFLAREVIFFPFFLWLSKSAVYMLLSFVPEPSLHFLYPGFPRTWIPALN